MLLSSSFTLNNTAIIGLNLFLPPPICKRPKISPANSRSLCLDFDFFISIQKSRFSLGGVRFIKVLIKLAAKLKFFNANAAFDAYSTPYDSMDFAEVSNVINLSTLSIIVFPIITSKNSLLYPRLKMYIIGFPM